MNWFKKIKAKLSQKLHDKLIDKLVKDKVFSLGDINLRDRIINTGFYSINMWFTEPKHEIILALLQKWYNYRFMEMRYTFTLNKNL